jgi:two-component system chemotaxis response regulator CheY
MQAASPLHVLVIDDHRTMRKIIGRCLREIGITAIDNAGNGAEALTWLSLPNNDPDVIICDLHMDEMDGLEFCNAVRRGKGLRDPNIPILLLTGESDRMLLEVAEQVGVKTVLQKPITAQELGTAIASVVGFEIAC